MIPVRHFHAVEWSGAIPNYNIEDDAIETSNTIEINCGFAGSLVK